MLHGRTQAGVLRSRALLASAFLFMLCVAFFCCTAVVMVADSLERLLQQQVRQQRQLLLGQRELQGRLSRMELGAHMPYSRSVLTGASSEVRDEQFRPRAVEYYGLQERVYLEY